MIDVRTACSEPSWRTAAPGFLACPRQSSGIASAARPRVPSSPDAEFPRTCENGGPRSRLRYDLATPFAQLPPTGRGDDPGGRARGRRRHRPGVAIDDTVNYGTRD